MASYNWQYEGWPEFTYRLDLIEKNLYAFQRQAGMLEGIANSLPGGLQLDHVLNTILIEAMKSSAIEGVYLSRQDVLSSLRKNLGLSPAPGKLKDQKAKGIADMLTDVRRTFNDHLDESKIFAWHTMLMADTKEVKVGAWRTHAEPMQVVSGAMGKEKVHFEAPPSSSVPAAMRVFIKWFNETAPGGKREISNGPVRSAIAHLYFETIHPFEDGNGRIGRALSEKALAQYMGRPLLFSLSAAIESAKPEYYKALEKAQRSNTVTPWLQYFVDTVLAALSAGLKQVTFTMQKAKFFDDFGKVLNDRQLAVVQRMFEAGPDGFEGGMNASKFVSIAKTSKATATRDLQDMVNKGILTQNAGGGRSTNYALSLKESNLLV